MKAEKSIIFNIIIAIVIASCFMALSGKGLLKRLELGSLDLLFRLRASSSCNPNIIIIEIDDDNISKMGRWPWQRQWHGVIIQALKHLGAKQIFFDMIFSETSTEEDDAIFAEAIKQAGNVYLPFTFLQGRAQDFDSALLPIERFASHIKGTGAISAYPDIDGIVRKVPMFYFVGENIHYNMALKLAMDHSNLRIKQITADCLVLADPGEKEIRIPLIERDRVLINWAGKWKDAFKHYSFVDVLAGYNSLLKNEAPHIDVEPFKDSICLVAVTALGLFDIKASPLEPQYPGIGVLAMAMRNVIEDDFIKMSPPWVKWASVYILALLVAFSILGRNPLRENLLIACVAAIFLITSFLCFKKGIIIDVSLPMLVLFVNYITISTYSYVRSSIEKQKFFKQANTDGLTGLYNHRYFKMILKTECLMAESEINKGFCVIMTDIDHFKNFNDNYGHQVGDLVLAGVANTLKSSVRYSDIVARYGGEEMIILLRNASLDDGVILSEKIRKNVEALELPREGGKPYKVTISLGVCCYNVRDSVETVIERADQALYKAKESGRNQSIAMETKSQSVATKTSEQRSSQK